MSLEQQHVETARALLQQLCHNVEDEYRIDGTPYRVDLKGELANGHFPLVEVKGFRDNVTPFVDAVFQAASYADAIQYPVFIGPIEGSRLDLSVGRLTNGLGIIHLMAGRLNVGFLAHTRWGGPYLMLRGQILVDGDGIRPGFDRHFGYITRSGSRQDRRH